MEQESIMGKLAGTIGTIAGAATGIPGGAQIGGALGGMIGGSGNVGGAYQGATAQQQQAAQAAAFRPVGITTTFGKSNFEVDPTTGVLKSAGYTLAPELQGLQTSLLGGFGGALSQAQGVDTTALQQGANTLYGLGQGYLSASPEEARQRYISQQQALLAPQQEQALAGIRNRLFQTGRGGLATGGTTAGNMQATNPELAAYYNALAQQQAQLAAGADQAAQQQIQFGQGLLSGGAGLQNTGFGLQSAAYSPLQTQLGLGQSIESLGQSPLDIGAQLGGRSATAGANVAETLYGASKTGLAGQLAQRGIEQTRENTLLSGLGTVVSSPKAQDWFSNILGGNNGPELLNWE